MSLSRLKLVRMHRGLTSGDLARKANVGVAVLSRIENDRVEPRQTTKQKLAGALGVDESWLFGKGGNHGRRL